MRLRKKSSLRVVEHAQLSDVGRQREGNEDSMLVDPPLFVVADGMGGAQAGEVASGLAVETLGEMPPDDGDVEEELTEAITRGQPPHPRQGPGRPRACRHGHDADRGVRPRRQGHARATSATRAPTAAATASWPS